MIAHDLLIAVLVTLAFSPALAEAIVGQASIVDGDTLEIHGQRIRLSGIDAPESDQLCRGDQYGRMVAVCSIDREDVADWLVRNGFAFDWPRYSNGKYTGAQ
ncbi:MAG: succinoglycan biosynthesis protein exoi [Nitrobacter sp.]